MARVLPLLLLAGLLVLVCVGAAGAQTYAEKLGYKPGDRVLIVHADDAGMCLSSTLGAIGGLERGIVTSTSIMMPCPWVGKMAQYVREHPQVDAGLHLALTAEHDFLRWPPVAGKSAVPGLADQWGCLWDNVDQVCQHATPDEIETEIRAQIDRALAFGIHPTHIDTHMGTLVARQDYLERYVKVGIEKGLPIMAFGSLPGEDFGPEITARYRQLLRQVWNAGLPVLDTMVNNDYGWKADEKKARYLELLRNLKPGVHLMIVHCAVPGEEIFSVNGLSAASRWIGDYEAMTDPEIIQLIKDQGIILSTWRECKERRLKYGKPE